VVSQAGDGRAALLARMPGIETSPPGSAQARPDEFRGPLGLEARSGVIEVELPDGARVRVDAFVDARALARVPIALKRRA
jgi:transposase